MTNVAAYFFLFFGVLSIVGGIIGWKKAGSKASLIAGCIAGDLLLAAGLCVIFDQRALGLGLGGVTGILLAGRFVPAFLKTKKVMPQGVMALSAVVAIALTATAWLNG